MGLAERRPEEIERADILVGIPCYKKQEIIEHVIQIVGHGLFKVLDIKELVRVSYRPKPR